MNLSLPAFALRFVGICSLVGLLSCAPEARVEDGEWQKIHGGVPSAYAAVMKLETSVVFSLDGTEQRSLVVDQCSPTMVDLAAIAAPDAGIAGHHSLIVSQHCAPSASAAKRDAIAGELAAQDASDVELRLESRITGGLGADISVIVDASTFQSLQPNGVIAEVRELRGTRQAKDLARIAVPADTEVGAVLAPVEPASLAPASVDVPRLLPGVKVRLVGYGLGQEQSSLDLPVEQVAQNTIFFAPGTGQDPAVPNDCIDRSERFAGKGDSGGGVFAKLRPKGNGFEAIDIDQMDPNAQEVLVGVVSGASTSDGMRLRAALLTENRLKRLLPH